MKSNVAIPLKYEIYLQDLSHDYQDLTLLGHAKTIEEARNCCRLFKDALFTHQARGVDIGKNLNNCTIIFRPILKKGVENE